MTTAPLVIVQPDAEPITIERARAHLRVDDESEDEAIMDMLAAAREHCEAFLGLSLSVRTLEVALDRFPRSTDIGGYGIDLPMGPVIAVLGITWGDESDEELTAADFVLDPHRWPSRLTPVAAGWPSVIESPSRIRIQYLAGFGDGSDGAIPLPRAIKAAILLMLEHLYRNRGATTEQSLQTVPLGVESLLRPHRVLLGMA